MSAFQEIKKYKIDPNILERYTLDKVCRPSTSASFEFGNEKIEVNCRSSSSVGLIEHVIAEDEDDFDNCIPTISVNANSQVIEVVPDVIAEREENAFRDAETCSKWTPSDTLAFLEAIKEVLTEEELSGGYLSRKNIFEKVAQLLKANGFNISSMDAEKKYNNMLVTYRRCQKRLMQKKQAPLWPYFKIIVETQTKFEELESNFSEKRIKRIMQLERRRHCHSENQECEAQVFSYPYVSTFFGGNKTLVPNCLTKKWQLKRAEQESKKIDIMKGVLLDRKTQRKRYIEAKRKLQMAMDNENKILSLF